MRYPIVIHHEKNSNYGVIVPDISGCFSVGDTLDEAIIQATEAIECHLEGMVLDGEAIPEPSSVEQHVDNPDYVDGVWAVVDIDLSKLSDKCIRVNITMPERVLAMIDHAAEDAGESRSGYMADAAIARMAH